MKKEKKEENWKKRYRYLKDDEVYIDFYSQTINDPFGKMHLTTLSLC